MSVALKCLNKFGNKNPRFYSTCSDSFQRWLTHTKQQCYVTHDHITPSAFNLFSNTLPTSSPTFPAANTLLPPGWHHIYFPPRTPEAELATDGYEQEFFPPGYSQRMWAGAQYTFSPDNPLRVGDHVTMKTYMHDIDINTAQATVWINKEISNKSGWSVTEKRCLVYHPHQRQMEQRGIRVRKKPDLTLDIMPSSILLFRYSALTFNSHKIHYDHEYATKVENHPACLVHGPLSGNLLLDMIHNHIDKRIHSFNYKCLLPLYVNQPIQLCAKNNDVWITNHQGHLAVKGSVTFGDTKLSHHL